MNKFSESVDPRFLGIFDSSSSKQNSIASDIVNSTNRKFNTKEKNSVSQRDSTHLPYLSEKLFAYFDSHIKEVERPKPVADLSDLQVCEIQMFKNSQPITGDEQEFVEERPFKKKKKKQKNKEKELWKQVAVTPEWLSQQAKILNS